MNDEEREHPGEPEENDAPGAGGDEAPDEREASDLDTGETSGLGLTEEFARIEAEIEESFGGQNGEQEHLGAEPDAEPVPSAGEPGEAPGGDPDAEDSSEWEPGEWEVEPGADPTPSDTAEAWVTEEEEAGVEERYGETGEYDVVPDTGEWTAESDAVPEPVEDREFDAPEADPVVPASEAHTQVQRPEPEPDAGPDEETEEPAVPIAAAGATEVRPPATHPGRLTPIPPARPPIGGGPPAISDEELDLKVPSLWLRFLSGSVLIVMSVAASVAIAGLLFLSDVAAKLQPIPGIQEQLTQVESDDPQTILIIGSDRRASDPEGVEARSDTAMLLRVDPDKKVLSLFSLPRDLKVNIPGYGVGRLNEAYTIGGETKTLKTVAQFTGIDINHVVEINFQGFADAVDAIGCVYIDVDRDYFNDNSTALTEEDQYAEIDINSGYQRLCGLKALQYVRYRHTDTDLVRAARQQDFLREARQKVEPRELIPGIGGTGNELIDIFTSYTRSDISESADVIGILKSFIAVRDVPVNKVEFQGDIGDATNTYVTSTSEQMDEAIQEFLNGPEERGGGSSGGKKSKKGKDKKKKKEKDPVEEADVLPTGDIPDEKAGTQAARLEKDANKNARRLKIPIFYPTVLVPGSQFDTGSRTYEYRNEDDKKEEGYKTVIAYTTPSTLTEYYGVMGTTWEDPPILRNPSETREINGREYMLFYDGDRLRMVGWQEKGNSYWVSNTLTQSIGEAEMLAIATTMNEVD